jgi:predicted hotdog family 3-hydroxylacyl-ACP dehydratase
MTTIDRETILGLIPHAGTMCLLDKILHWDETSLRGLSHRYRDTDNPLRRADGSLGTATGIEIAAQAMAAHGSLSAPQNTPPSRGYLVSLRDVALTAGPLDANGGDLLIEILRLLGDKNLARYQFSLTAAGVPLLRGNATVLLGPTA